MSGVQRVRDSHAQIEQLFEIKRFASNSVFEGLAFEQLHGDERLFIGFFHRIDCADVRVIKRRSGEGFALEAFACAGIFSRFFGKKFQRDAAVQLQVFGFVDHAHSAAELSNDAVVRNQLVLGEVGAGHGGRF